MDFIKKDYYLRLIYHLELKDEKAPAWFSKPLEVSFILGREPVPKIIEEAVMGKREGDEVEVVIPPETAYGPRLPYLIKEVDIKTLKYPEKVKVGEWYEEINKYGSRVSFKVLEIKEDKIKADFNHPAAGKEVIMKIKILEARPANPFEILSAEMRAYGCGG